MCTVSSKLTPSTLQHGALVSSCKSACSMSLPIMLQCHETQQYETPAKPAPLKRDSPVLLCPSQAPAGRLEGLLAAQSCQRGVQARTEAVSDMQIYETRNCPPLPSRNYRRKPDGQPGPPRISRDPGPEARSDSGIGRPRKAPPKARFLRKETPKN